MSAFCGAVLALFVLQPPAYGQDPGPDPAATARSFLDQGDYDEAFRLYSDLFREDPGNPDISFNLGRAAFERGDYETAVMAFERVLIEHPDVPRVKLELARSYFGLGFFEAAKQSFGEVLAVNPPDTVRANIMKYLKVIEETRKEHFFTGRVYVGMDFDDNVKASPTASDVDITTILGDIIAVPMDRPEKDQIATSMATLNYVFRPMDGKVSWKVSGTNYNAVYRDADDLDLNLFDLRAGAGIEGERVLLDIYGLTSLLNLDYSRYLQINGAGMTVSLAATPGLLLSLDSRFRKKNYNDYNAMDADNLSFTFSPVFAAAGGRVSLSLGWERENAKDNVNTYSRLNAIAGYEVKLPFATTAYASYWYQDTRYQDDYPLFGKKRNDDIQYVMTGLTKAIDLGRHAPERVGLNLSLNYTYTRADSSIELYAYTKNVLSAGVSVTF